MPVTESMDWTVFGASSYFPPAGPESRNSDNGMHAFCGGKRASHEQVAPEHLGGTPNDVDNSRDGKGASDSSGKPGGTVAAIALAATGGGNIARRGEGTETAEGCRIRGRYHSSYCNRGCSICGSSAVHWFCAVCRRPRSRRCRSLTH